VLGKRTLLMGIVNITPDSFSDGGRFLEASAACEHALKLQAEGADLLDFGAESTRPGSDPVPISEQLRRLLPVFENLHDKMRVPISVDTSYADVAGPCIECGAAIINDIAALSRDETLAALCAGSGVGVVLMHMRGAPKTMQQNTHYDDVGSEVRGFLQQRTQQAMQAGIPPERMVVDPGIGFGKSFEQNYSLLGNLRHLRGLGAGILAGPSRKGFTGEFNGLPPEQRQFSSAAAVALAVLHGADIVRVHDVAEMRQVTDIVDRFRMIQSEIHNGNPATQG
jgi:dihydropteroate synthase